VSTLRAVLRVILVLLAALVLAGCGGEGTGLNAEEAMNAVEDRVQQSGVSSLDIYAGEALKETAPSGEEAWLVRVYYTGGSTCMYVWYRETKYHLKPDRGCSHWKSD
jgi:predicted small secreted protein